VFKGDHGSERATNYVPLEETFAHLISRLQIHGHIMWTAT
jgi:hypothetical protein